MTPTVGRVVWYNPASDENINRVPGQPLAAMIACVNEDGTINLGLLDRDGVSCHRVNVHLLDPGTDAGVDETAAFACWMPYQIGQAQKTEQLQAALGDARLKGPEGATIGPESSAVAGPAEPVAGDATAEVLDIVGAALDVAEVGAEIAQDVEAK